MSFKNIIAYEEIDSAWLHLPHVAGTISAGTPSECVGYQSRLDKSGHCIVVSEFVLRSEIFVHRSLMPSTIPTI